MTQATLDVLCIGNAIVDVITDADDAFLANQGLDKGSMRLIDLRHSCETELRPGTKGTFEAFDGAGNSSGIKAFVVP